MTPRQIRSLVLPIFATGIVLFVLGCAPKAPEEKVATPVPTVQTDATPSVEKAREVARISLEIEKEPGRTTVILDSHGMTPGGFEDLLYAIAQDTALTEAYEAARTKAP